jgi:hypothetical protein
MILRQAMFTAEIVSAVWTLERNERFLPALLALHSHARFFFKKENLVV